MSPGNRWVDRALGVHRTERGTKAALALTGALLTLWAAAAWWLASR